MALIVAAVGSYLLKLAGLSLPESVLNHPPGAAGRRASAGRHAGRPGRGRSCSTAAAAGTRVDWRTLAGVGAAVVALLLRRGFLVVFLVAITVTALLRLVTWTEGKVGQEDTGGTPATVALSRAGISFTLHPYAHQDDATNFGDEAAAALGLKRTRMFKTLVADLGGELVVAVVPVAYRLDLKALAAAVGAKKAAMADPAAAARSSGYVVGGISPIGQRTRLRTVVDASAQDFPTIFVSAGKRGLQVELAPADLAAVTGAISRPDRPLSQV